jgi:hypothetical protein
MMKSSYFTAILVLTVFFSTTVFSSPEDDLAAQTGGVAMHLNKADFIKQMNTNPKAFTDAVVNQTLNCKILITTQIPLTEVPASIANIKEFSMEIKPVVSAFNIVIVSAGSIAAFTLYNPGGAIVKPDFINPRVTNGKMNTRLYVQSPAPGTWKIKIDDIQPITITASYTTESNRVILWQAYNVAPVANGRIRFPVDPTISNLSIVVSAKTKKPILQLLGPDNKPTTVTDTSLSATTFKSIEKPLPGIWTLLIASEEEFTVQIAGQSTSFIVKQEFQRKVLGHGGWMNIPDSKSLLAGSQKPFELELISNANMALSNFKILLVSLSGNVISETDVSTISRLNDWLDLQNLTLQIPNESFRVMITGKDSAGYIYQRMGNILYQVIKN